jgi:glycosyltransferase involved in cell wall biosynthesis
MRRLMYVTTVPATLRAFLLPFASHFRKQGWRVDAAANGASRVKECRDAFDAVYDLPLSRNPFALSHLFRAIPLIRRLSNKNGYDIVHVHTPVAAFVTRLGLRPVRRRGRPKVIYTAHGFHFHALGSPLNNAVYIFLERLAGRWTDYLVVINREDREAALRYKIVPPERLRFISGIGVDTRHYGPIPISSDAVQSIRRRSNLGDAAPLFLMIAEFNPGKRHCDTVEALARMETRTTHLAFAGTGPLMQATRDRVRQLGLADRVHFLGFLPDVRPWIAACTATLLPSIREGLPRSTLESMSMGIPAIGTRIRGLEELLEDDCGILVPAKDSRSLAAAMDRMCRDAEWVRSMGQKARERILNQYSLDHVLTCHEKLYTEALQAPA